MIRTEGLSKRYGTTLALDGLSLEVPDGSVLGLLGPNGAGKSTLLKLAMGFVFPDGGQIDLGGLIPSRIGYLPEQMVYPPRFRVREFLTVVGRLAGLGGFALRSEIERLVQQLDLEEASGQRLGTCSRGQLQRVGVAQSLLGDPPLLLLDEPVQGLDPSGQKHMRDRIRDLHGAGKTVILSSHNLGEVTRVCTHIAVLKDGRLVRWGTLKDLSPPRARVTITTGPMSQNVAGEMADLGPGVYPGNRRVVLEGEGLQHKAEVLMLLMQAGVDIRDLSEQHTSLEEIYLEATDT